MRRIDTFLESIIKTTVSMNFFDFDAILLRDLIDNLKRWKVKISSCQKTTIAALAYKWLCSKLGRIWGRLMEPSYPLFCVTTVLYFLLEHRRQSGLVSFTNGSIRHVLFTIRTGRFTKCDKYRQSYDLVYLTI